MSNRTRGLTLTEVLITVCLASIVALALYSMLSQGINVWKAIQREIPEEDVAIFFDKFSVELKNTFTYPKMLMAGNGTSFSFPTFVRDREQYPQGDFGLGVVTYSFDEDGQLARSYQTISDIFREKQSEKAPVFSRLGNCSFSYYFFDEDSKEYMWGSEWPPVNMTVQNNLMPLGVRVMVNLTFGNKDYEYNKFVYLPLSKKQ